MYIEDDSDVNGYGVDYGQFDDARGYCKHGQYTGGSGIDFMCGYCEDGLDQWYPETYYRYIVVVRHHDDYTKFSSHVGNRHRVREEAEADCDSWEKSIGDTDNIVALLVYSQQGGYWGEREREKEHVATLQKAGETREYRVYYRFPHELEYLQNRVRAINESENNDSWHLIGHDAYLDVHDMVAIMERNPDDYR